MSKGGRSVGPLRDLEQRGGSGFRLERLVASEEPEEPGIDEEAIAAHFEVHQHPALHEGVEP